jgi:hypothetical protein
MPTTTSGGHISILLLFTLLFNHMIATATAVSLAGSVMATKKYVELGVCENMQTGTKRCAMQVSDCQFDHWNGEMAVHLEAFYSAQQQKQFGYEDAACFCENTQIGSCDDRCSPQRYGYCFKDESFQENFSSLTSTTDPSGSSTTNTSSNSSCSCQSSNYGACQNIATGQYFCAFSPNDCVVDGHFWIHPQDTQEAIGIVCTCDRVRVGGCVGERGHKFTCAVSADDCSRDEFYQAPYTLKRTTGRTCNLCKPLSSSSSNEEGSTSIVPYEDELSHVDKETAGHRMSGLSRVGSTFLALFVFGAMVALVLFLYSKKRRSTIGTDASGANPSASEWRFLRRSKSGSKDLEICGSSSQDGEQMFPCVMAKGLDAEII